MDNIEGLRRQLLSYSDKLKKAEEEILELKRKLYVSEGKIEVLSQFYQDFKHLVGTDIPFDNTKPEYDSLLSHYFVKKDNETVQHLFDDYDKDPVEVLNDVLNLNNLDNPLPSNIEEIVKKHGIVKEYEIIQKSLELIRNLNKSSKYIEKGIYHLCDLYVNSYKKNNKKQALRYLKIALIIYPLNFDKFYDDIKTYLYDDINEIIKDIKTELYGEDNILLSKEEKASDLDYKDLPMPKGMDDLLDAKSTRNIEKYRNFSIQEFVQMVTSQHERAQTMKAKRVYSYLIRLKKPPEECLAFYNEVNKQIKFKMK